MGIFSLSNSPFSLKFTCNSPVFQSICFLFDDFPTFEFIVFILWRPPCHISTMSVFLSRNQKSKIPRKTAKLHLFENKHIKFPKKLKENHIHNFPAQYFPIEKVDRYNNFSPIFMCLLWKKLFLILKKSAIFNALCDRGEEKNIATFRNFFFFFGQSSHRCRRCCCTRHDSKIGFFCFITFFTL